MDSIDKKICHLAESLLIKGEFLSWRRFSLQAFSISDIEIAPVCNRQSDRIVVEKIMATSIVDSHSRKDVSTTYLVEVLAAVSIVCAIEEKELTIVTSDSLNSYEQPFTFTICHECDDSFVLIDVRF
jgi:hypothetical protein